MADAAVAARPARPCFFFSSEDSSIEWLLVVVAEVDCSCVTGAATGTAEVCAEVVVGTDLSVESSSIDLRVCVGEETTGKACVIVGAGDSTRSDSFGA
jgi:hypothetical protein